VKKKISDPRLRIDFCELNKIMIIFLPS